MRYVGLILVVFLVGCGLSETELREKTGDAAVSIKRGAESAGDRMQTAYDDAAAKGRDMMKNAEKDLSEAALRAKIQAGFKLVAGLNSENIKIDIEQGKVKLSGTVPTQLDKMKAEGVAYGVTGSPAGFTSAITVKE